MATDVTDQANDQNSSTGTMGNEDGRGTFRDSSSSLGASNPNGEKEDNFGVKVVIVILLWLVFFSLGTWVPGSEYLMAVLYGKPVPWEKNLSGELVADYLVPDDQSRLERLMEIAPALDGESEELLLEVSRTGSPGSSNLSGSAGSNPELLASHRFRESKDLPNLVRKALFEKNGDTSENVANFVANFFRKAFPTSETTVSPKFLHVTLKRFPTPGTFDPAWVWLKRWLIHLPVGLLSSTLFNLALLCTFSSMAGEYTRCILPDSQNNGPSHNQPKPRDAIVRGFVVFLLFVSGQLIFLGDIPGGPSSSADLLSMTQGTYVRIAGFSSILCLTCSYSPAIINELLARIALLLAKPTEAQSNGLQPNPDKHKPNESQNTTPAVKTKSSLPELWHQCVQSTRGKGTAPTDDEIRNATRALAQDTDDDTLKAFLESVEATYEKFTDLHPACEHFLSVMRDTDDLNTADSSLIDQCLKHCSST